MKRPLFAIALVVIALLVVVIARRPEGPRRQFRLKNEIASRHASLAASALGQTATSPIRIQFEIPESIQLNQPTGIVLSVRSNPQQPFSSTEPLDRFEILLRLPPGIRLMSGESWQAVPAPPEDAGDPSGPWSLFERAEPFPKVLPPSGGISTPLVQVPVSFVVAEEGINWIITARARIVQQEKLAGQAFGVLFATRQGEKVEFHTTPHAQTD